VYISASSLWQTQSTTGFVALSTVYGIITDIEARRYNVGGEVLFGIN
jgi:ribosomal protein S8